MTKTQESVLIVLARIVKFLDVDLLRTISGGRAVLEPQKDWAPIADATAELRAMKFLLTDRQNAVISSVSVGLEHDLNAIAAFFRELPARRSTASEAALLAEVNALLAQARGNGVAPIEALKSTFNGR